MPEPSIEVIRQAITKNRGGWEKADKPALLAIWRSLDEKTQAQYLESLQEKEAKADDRTQPQPNV